MADGREYLPEGTLLELEEGHMYTIIGKPVGSGGGSVIYPARRLVRKEDRLEPDGFLYALKECYPVSVGHSYVRDSRGQIVPGTDSRENGDYLNRARQLQREESLVSRDVYKTASRVLPIREISERVLLTLPGRDGEWVNNTVTVMESLSEKGRSLSSWLREHRRFQPLETLRIIQQLLFALEEVHRAGYLHLDIQDGNVFLRGALEDRSELVTLIDFGSARAMDQGKTEPIRDRVIFTTQGFSAPEILTRNDGTLRLGPEADLYSVGCLALYLLTGQRPDSRLLRSNTSGLYLKPNQLRRMKCPAHLVGRLQQLLDRALITVEEGSGAELQTCNALHLLDRETGEVRTLLNSDSAIGKLCFDGDALAVFRCKGISLTTVYNISYDYREPCSWWMERYDLSSGKLLWSVEGSGYLESGEVSDIAVMDYDTGSERGTGILFAYYDYCTLLDRETGSQIRDYKLPSALMLVRPRDNWIQTLNTDGSCTIADFTSDTTLNIGIFKDTVSEAHWVGDWFYVQNTTLQNRDHTIHQYQVNRSDTSYGEHFTADSQSWRTRGFRNSPEGWTAVLASNIEPVLCLANLDTGVGRVHRVPASYGFESYNILGLSEDGYRLYWYQYGEWEDPECWIESKHYFCMDLRTGEIKRLRQPEKPHESLYVDELLVDGDTFVFTGAWREGLSEYQSVYTWDALTGQLREIACWELENGKEETGEGIVYWFEDFKYQSFSADLTVKELSFVTYDSRTDQLCRLMSVNWETGESRSTVLRAELLPDPDHYGTWRRGRSVRNREGSRIAMGVADILWIFDGNGGVQYQIPMEEELAGVWFSLEEPYLMTVTENGVICKYRAEDGSEVSRLDLKDHREDFLSIYDDWELYYPDGDTMVAVTADGGFLLDIAGDGLNMKAVIDQCIGYDALRNRILIEEKYAYSGKNTTIGSFRHYTTEDLIQMAKSLLNP